MNKNIRKKSIYLNISKDKAINYIDIVIIK